VRKTVRTIINYALLRLARWVSPLCIEGAYFVDTVTSVLSTV
jgi:hypothetical protein